MKLFISAAWSLVMRDYRVRFRRTLLGIVWFLVPLFALVGMALLVGKDAGLYAGEESGFYFVQLLSGLVLWQLLADTWLEPMRFARRANMILRAVTFDQRTLLLAGALSALVAFALKLPVLIAALLWFQPPLNFSIGLLPLGICALIATGMTLACFTLPVSLALLDVRYALPFVQYALLLATPIFYTAPEKGLVHWVNQYNPFTYLVPPVRDMLTGQPFSVVPVLLSSVIIAVLLGVGLTYFQAKVRLAIAYIGH